MVKPIPGVIHGTTIELKENPGFADGEEVEVVIKTLPTETTWGDGLRRCAGEFAADWTEDDDRILEQIHEERRRDARKEIAG